jgi:16S rRNA (guanine966-N2)-methyltransferase
MRKNTPKTRAHQLRIIGGQWRGRKLPIADVDGLRPTGDRIRETVFNWLMGDIVGSHCLDIFAGSGALGLECLSRGAAHVTLLEKHPEAATQLKQHCQTLGTTQGKVIQCNALDWLHAPSIPTKSIDIVFIDPPFDHALWVDTIDKLQASGLLNNEALIYIESPKHTPIPTPSHWHLHKEKQAGQVSYRLFCYQPN